MQNDMRNNVLETSERGADPDPETLAFYHRHEAQGPGHQILAKVLAPCKDCGNPECVNFRESTGVFSTFAKAQAWVETFPEDHPAVYGPLVLDNPNFGKAALN